MWILESYDSEGEIYTVGTYSNFMDAVAASAAHDGDTRITRIA